MGNSPDWPAIYSAGRNDWICILRSLSPILAHRVESGQFSLSHALQMIGVSTGAFELGGLPEPRQLELEF